MDMSLAADPITGFPGRLTLPVGRRERVLHVEVLPARAGVSVPWPAWADPEVVAAFGRQGIALPWRHQSEAARAAWSGEHVALATGTASGKSLAYQLVALTAARSPRPGRVGGRGSGSLYLSPTKALAADQLAALERLAVPGVRVATFDGDTPPDQRLWAREHAEVVLTNPDALHHSLLPGHVRWASFLRSLRLVVLDESHHYRGVFGAHVAAIIRRLRRLAARYGADPVFVTVSATVGDPAGTASALTGLSARAVDQDASPRGATRFLLWEPPLLPGGGENGAPTRRTALAETAELLADLVIDGTRALAFVPSRQGVEVVAAITRRLVGEIDTALVERVSAYRGGYLPEERRTLEADLRSGHLLALAATNALELGIDISGLDAVLICGWPGRRASLWQQAGRAGRRGQDALAVLIARDDPLDTYLVHHPEAIFGPSVEASVLDPANPYVLAPQLCAAAAELPLTTADAELFGPDTIALADALTGQGTLRRRPSGWFWTRPDRAADLADLRGTGGDPVQIVDAGTGRVIGSVDATAAHHTVHAGAVYLHQGRSWLVTALDLKAGLALVEPTGDQISTQARDVSDLRVLGERCRRDWGAVAMVCGTVEVTSQVVSFIRRTVRDGRVLGEHRLDLPARTLRTSAVWWTMPADLLADHGIGAAAVPGAAHAAEHAAIGMLPLVATCDRWDVGGVSTAMHPDTGLPTIFVHDGHPGGAGFAERGFSAAATWLEATRSVIRECECETGCPSCVQSPKCGNGNEPLNKDAAARLLDAVLARADPAGA
jgi:DEAD/DEAH box helicase domain-containing protein